MTDKLDLTPAEKQANAERTNAFQELAKQMNTMLQAAGGNVNLLEILHSVKQLQISLEVFVDLVLENRLVAAVPNPFAPPDDENAAPGVTESTVTRLEYWKRVAARAEREKDLLLRQMLSAGNMRYDGSAPSRS